MRVDECVGMGAVRSSGIVLATIVYRDLALVLIGVSQLKVQV